MISIPITDFDQSKLEQLLRHAPAAYVRSEKKDSFVRKHYLYPRKKGELQIKCHGDYYLNAPIPSFERCSVTSSARVSGDEVMVQIKNIGLPERKFYSTERVYGQSFDGTYRQLFRYMFDCSVSVCKISFATKPAL